MGFVQALRIGSYKKLLDSGVLARPYYGYSVYKAAQLAQRLGLKRISVIEFGVAGGNGLVNLEWHAKKISKLFGVEIEIYGFDSGEGLPAPADYRDLPYHWKKGSYKMDVPKLKSRLKKARLVLGDVSTTVKSFFAEFNPAPIGAISFDLDFYSSTKIALRIFEADEKFYLPRVYSYFDDTIGEEELFNEFTGERLAIQEFNQEHETMKLGFVNHFLAEGTPKSWFYKIWVCHMFRHSQYNVYVGEDRVDPLGLRL